MSDNTLSSCIVDEISNLIDMKIWLSKTTEDTLFVEDTKRDAEACIERLNTLMERLLDF